MRKDRINLVPPAVALVTYLRSPSGSASFLSFIAKLTSNSEIVVAVVALNHVLLVSGISVR